MTAALTPALAIAYVRELSADVLAVVVLGADGALLAGPPALAEPARVYLGAAATATDAATRRPDGVVIAARTDRHAVVVCAGPLSLLGPTALDARAAVDGLGESRAAGSAVQSQTFAADVNALETAAEAVISATHREI